MLALVPGEEDLSLCARKHDSNHHRYNRRSAPLTVAQESPCTHD
jgi:hypothetical protein